MLCYLQLDYDAGFTPNTMGRVLACGLGLDLSEAPFSDYRPVQLEDFVARLRGIIIPVTTALLNSFAAFMQSIAYQPSRATSQ